MRRAILGVMILLAIPGPELAHSYPCAIIPTNCDPVLEIESITCTSDPVPLDTVETCGYDPDDWWPRSETTPNVDRFIHVGVKNTSGRRILLATLYIKPSSGTPLNLIGLSPTAVAVVDPDQVEKFTVTNSYTNAYPLLTASCAVRDDSSSRSFLIIVEAVDEAGNLVQSDWVAVRISTDYINPPHCPS